MKYNIRKNWVGSFELLTTHPRILAPFVIFAFFEALALELIYFSPRKPLMHVFNPLVQKFFGEQFIHYPKSFVLLPQLFHNVQIPLYIFLGVFLAAITANMVKKTTMRLPVKREALIKNASGRYWSFVAYGVLLTVLMWLVKYGDTFVFYKFARLASRRLPTEIVKFMPIVLPAILFITNVILYTFLILIVPIIVIKKSSFMRAMGESLYLGFSNFPTIFKMIFIPFLIYFPLALLNAFSIIAYNELFPEMLCIIAAMGIVASLFVECFVIVCVTRFLLDKYKGAVKIT